MTHRERMLAAIRGEPTDEIPWAPRMDLWCIAQRARGTTPPHLAGLDIAGLADALEVGCRALRADYTHPEGPDDLILRGLGLENHPDFPYRVELRDLPLEVRREGDECRLTIRTPAGTIQTHVMHTDAMRREGISLPFVKQFAIFSPDDFEAVAQIFEHLEVIPTPGAYAAFRHRIGERGLAIANGCIGASPLHHVFHELVSPEQFFYLYADDRDALHALARRMEPFYDRVLDAVLQCEAEVVFWSGNYDQDVTWPAFFQAEITPWLKRVADRVHVAGKFLLTHADGENHRLLPLYPPCGFDVAESVCPAPMTRCTLREIQEGMGPRVTVWGGIPSAALLQDAMSDAMFERYLNETFAELGTGERLILGVSDMVPPDADLSRLERIKERIAAFGAVRPGPGPGSGASAS